MTERGPAWESHGARRRMKVLAIALAAMCFAVLCLLSIGTTGETTTKVDVVPRGQNSELLPPIASASSMGPPENAVATDLGASDVAPKVDSATPTPLLQPAGSDSTAPAEVGRGDTNEGLVAPGALEMLRMAGLETQEKASGLERNLPEVEVGRRAVMPPLHDVVHLNSDAGENANDAPAACGAGYTAGTDGVFHHKVAPGGGPQPTVVVDTLVALLFPYASVPARQVGVFAESPAAAGSEAVPPTEAVIRAMATSHSRNQTGPYFTLLDAADATVAVVPQPLRIVTHWAPRVNFTGRCFSGKSPTRRSSRNAASTALPPKTLRATARI